MKVNIQGKIATVKTMVDNTNVAKTVGSGSLDVFSTPMMIALMEKAACAVFEEAGALETGETTVGTKISVEHIAATATGAEVSASAKAEAVNGRMVEFTVTAFEGDKKIGFGTHTRAVIDAERFMAKLTAQGF